MDNDVMVTLSFSSYSTDGLASIAVKVSEEFNQQQPEINHNFNGLIDDDDDFEFSLILDDQSFQADPAIYYNRDFLDRSKIGGNNDFSIKIPLKDLFAYDREEYCSSSTSSSASETGNELELITEFRTPASKWKKSNSSAGARRRKSKGWNIICDLFRRSNSDGKDDGRKPGAAKMKAYLTTPMEVFYVRNKAEKEGVNRKSYIPYRQQLVGFFGRKY